MVSHNREDEQWYGSKEKIDLHFPQRICFLSNGGSLAIYQTTRWLPLFRLSFYFSVAFFFNLCCIGVEYVLFCRRDQHCYGSALRFVLSFYYYFACFCTITTDFNFFLKILPSLFIVLSSYSIPDWSLLGFVHRYFIPHRCILFEISCNVKESCYLNRMKLVNFFFKFTFQRQKVLNKIHRILLRYYGTLISNTVMSCIMFENRDGQLLIYEARVENFINNRGITYGRDSTGRY